VYNRTNHIKLKDYKVPDSITINNNLASSIKDSELVIVAVPASVIEEVIESMKDIVSLKQHICIATKGIQENTCLFVVDVLKKYIDTENYAILSGGGFATDMIKNVPIGLSLATTNEETEKVVRCALESDVLKLRETKDIIGVEICGAIKNVIAIASGMIYGMGLPESTKAMFITESLHDIKQLIFALGGDKKTILSFAGFGDLFLTCTSEKSRNFTLGKMIGERRQKSDIDYYIENTTIEGLYTLKSIYKLVKNKKVEMPIIDLIYDIIFKDKDCDNLIKFLIEKE
jgi:glycerol-3-phosphate dehydrogenase (NAD(P)+)